VSPREPLEEQVLDVQEFTRRFKSGPILSSVDTATLFVDFKTNFARKYADAQEEAKRYEIFLESLAAIDWLNTRNPLALFSVTQFADWSLEEKVISHKKMRNGFAQESRAR